MPLKKKKRNTISKKSLKINLYFCLNFSNKPRKESHSLKHGKHQCKHQQTSMSSPDLTNSSHVLSPSHKLSALSGLFCLLHHLSLSPLLALFLIFPDPSCTSLQALSNIEQPSLSNPIPVLSDACNSVQLNKSRSAWQKTQENTPVYFNILFIAKSLFLESLAFNACRIFHHIHMP